MEWELGDWLPITWEPAAEAEIEYMEFVREKVRKEHDRYLERIKQKYNVTKTNVLTTNS